MGSILKFKKKLDSRGITLIALVITIIVLLILAGISIAALTADNGIVKEARTAKELAEKAALEEQVEMAIIKAEQKHKNPTLDDVINELKNEKIIDDEKQVNRETGAITSNLGYIIEGKLDDYIGKVSTGGDNAGLKPEFNVEQQINGTTVIITVTVTNDVGNVDSIVVTNTNNGTNIEGTVNGKTGTFNTTLNGYYKIEVKATTDGVQKTAEKVIEVNEIPVTFSQAYGRIEVVWLDTNDNVIAEPNKPNLGNMTPVKWNGFSESETTSSDTEWYDYKAKTGTEDNLDSHWANAKNKVNNVDSYFVWIPRYAYRITYYENKESNQITGYCDGKGIREVNGTVR